MWGLVERKKRHVYKSKVVRKNNEGGQLGGATDGSARQSGAQQGRLTAGEGEEG